LNGEHLDLAIGHGPWTINHESSLGIIFMRIWFNLLIMKKDKKSNSHIGKAQDITKDLPVKNATTNATKNTAVQTPGLNQEKTSRDDLFPSDGDNMTS